eukprot:SAG22_NODE_286_length_12969_cov_6.982828_2_plen_316_part_00
MPPPAPPGRAAAAGEEAERVASAQKLRELKELNDWRDDMNRQQGRHEALSVAELHAGLQDEMNTLWSHVAKLSERVTGSVAAMLKPVHEDLDTVRESYEELAHAVRRGAGTERLGETVAKQAAEADEMRGTMASLREEMNHWWPGLAETKAASLQAAADGNEAAAAQLRALQDVVNSIAEQGAAWQHKQDQARQQAQHAAETGLAGLTEQVARLAEVVAAQPGRAAEDAAEQVQTAVGELDVRLGSQVTGLDARVATLESVGVLEAVATQEGMDSLASQIDRLGQGLRLQVDEQCNGAVETAVAAVASAVDTRVT